MMKTDSQSILSQQRAASRAGGGSQDSAVSSSDEFDNVLFEPSAPLQSSPDAGITAPSSSSLPPMLPLPPLIPPLPPPLKTQNISLASSPPLSGVATAPLQIGSILVHIGNVVDPAPGEVTIDLGAQRYLKEVNYRILDENEFTQILGLMSPPLTFQEQQNLIQGFTNGDYANIDSEEGTSFSDIFFAMGGTEGKALKRGDIMKNSAGGQAIKKGSPPENRGDTNALTITLSNNEYIMVEDPQTLIIPDQLDDVLQTIQAQLPDNQKEEFYNTRKELLNLLPLSGELDGYQGISWQDAFSLMGGQPSEILSYNNIDVIPIKRYTIDEIITGYFQQGNIQDPETKSNFEQNILQSIPYDAKQEIIQMSEDILSGTPNAVLDALAEIEDIAKDSPKAREQMIFAVMIKAFEAASENKESLLRVKNELEGYRATFSNISIDGAPSERENIKNAMIAAISFNGPKIANYFSDAESRDVIREGNYNLIKKYYVQLGFT